MTNMQERDVGGTSTHKKDSGKREEENPVNTERNEVRDERDVKAMWQNVD